jgi:hypothetical protein
MYCTYKIKPGISRCGEMQCLSYDKRFVVQKLGVLCTGLNEVYQKRFNDSIAASKSASLFTDGILVGCAVGVVLDVAKGSLTSLSESRAASR